jgi:hypothetical protein
MKPEKHRLRTSVNTTTRWTYRSGKKELEDDVRPRITTKATGMLIRFRGQYKYAKLDESKGLHGNLALQALYGIERAQKSGDIQAIINSAVAFGRDSLLSDLRKVTGQDAISATFAEARLKSSRREGRRNTRKWTRDIDKLARPIFSEFARTIISENGAASRTLATLKSKQA